MALVGGGNNPQPGEISLAHNGVLFLDEMPELSRSVLEVLRQPLEDRKITIIRARNIQTERFSSLPLGEGGGRGRIHCNAQMTEKMLHQFAEPDAASLDMLRMAMERLKLSARAYSRILKVARTIADLEGSEKVEAMHIAEAIGYRNLDRGDWAERGL